MHTAIRMLVAYAMLFTLALAFMRGAHSSPQSLRVVPGARGAYAYLVTRLLRWRW